MAITRLGGANAITGTIPQGNIANASLGAVTALPGAIATGKVLQSVYANTSTQVDVTSTTWTDVLSASITPASTSNKVLVLAAIGGLNRHSGDTELQLRVTRDGSQVQQIKGLNNGSNNFLTEVGAAMNELDTPSSTSALTYKIQLNNRDANGTVTAGSNSANSSLVLMEIEGW